MKAEELRIGNFIKDRGEKIWQIDHWESSDKVAAKEPVIGYCDFTNKPMHGHPLTEDVDFLSPVELTEEWLLKFGFKKQKLIVTANVYCVQCVKNKLYFSIFEKSDYEDPNEISLKETKKWWSFHNNTHDVKIKYVHQLQNLYFSLTGEELTLTK